METVKGTVTSIGIVKARITVMAIVPDMATAMATVTAIVMAMAMGTVIPIVTVTSRHCKYLHPSACAHDVMYVMHVRVLSSVHIADIDSHNRLMFTLVDLCHSTSRICTQENTW